MSHLHLDCFSGVSGDMLLSALTDAGASLDPLREALARLDLPVTVDVEQVSHCGIRALHLLIEAPEDQPTRNLPEIENLIRQAGIPERAQTRTLGAFRELASAEAEIHNTPIDKVHFHEVGALDSITDLMGCALALEILGIDTLSSRPVPLGSGMVTCEHGRMPIPAPATALMARGMPVANPPVTGELTTPTGAAMLKAWVTEWRDQPPGYDKVGTGAGTRRYIDHPNLLRVFLGAGTGSAWKSERIARLETWVDDVPGDVISHLLAKALTNGALDASAIPVLMKKGRPGHAITLLAKPADAHSIAELVFRETGTLGIRHEVVERWVLPRREGTAETPWGTVRVKWARLAPGDERPDPEHEDCAELARKHGVALSIIRDAALEAARWNLGQT